VLVWAVSFWPGRGPSVCPLQEDLRWREQLTAVTGPVNQDIHPPLERQVMLRWCQQGAVRETHQHSNRQIIGKAPSAQCVPCISGHVICMPWCLQSVASCGFSITHTCCLSCWLPPAAAAEGALVGLVPPAAPGGLEPRQQQLQHLLQVSRLREPWPAREGPPCVQAGTEQGYLCENCDAYQVMTEL
jgi:hypothetical protein